MQSKTEEFLNLLLWSATMLSRPTFRNLTDSYESWAYRSGFMRQVAALEKLQILDRDASLPDDRLYRLSAAQVAAQSFALSILSCGHVEDYHSQISVPPPGPACLWITPAEGM